MDPGVIVALAFIVAGLLMVLIGVWYQKSYTSDQTNTQRVITDAALIKLFSEQADGLLSPHRLQELTGITLSQARRRLQLFSHNGLLQSAYNSKGRYFYSLATPYKEPPVVAMSNDPFLTMEDLLSLYAADDDGQLTLQEMILATGLPLTVIIREMKHFAKEGIVQQLYTMDASMSTVRSRFYVLEEPYRSNPGRLREKAGALDLELKELLTNENLIV